MFFSSGFEFCFLFLKPNKLARYILAKIIIAISGVILTICWLITILRTEQSYGRLLQWFIDLIYWIVDIIGTLRLVSMKNKKR